MKKFNTLLLMLLAISTTMLAQIDISQIETKELNQEQINFLKENFRKKRGERIEIPGVTPDEIFNISFDNGEQKNFRMMTMTMGQTTSGAIVRLLDENNEKLEGLHIDNLEIVEGSFFLSGGTFWYIYYLDFSLKPKIGFPNGNYNIHIVWTHLDSNGEIITGLIVENISVSITNNIFLPVANFEIDKTEGDKPLAVQFSDKSENEINEWLWDFGDGNTSTEQNPQHTYETAGDYTVSLKVTGPGGEDTKMVENLITVIEPAPIADFETDNTEGDKPLAVKFSDKSQNVITEWLWDFGDGNTSTEQNPQHTYETAGDFIVSLKVTGPGGEDTKTVENLITVIEPAPIADFETDKTEGDKPLAVQFSDKSENEITEWLWDFGDGNTSTEQNPQHTYETAGDFTVSLKVTGPGGEDTKTVEDLITVIEPAPIADFETDKTEGDKPLAVQFSDKSENEITEWLWDFGDGNTSTEQNPQHTYETAGDFTVSLKVTGPGGEDTKTEEKLIKVNDVTGISYNKNAFIEFYPNPSNGIIKINGLTKQSELEIYSLSGVLIRKAPVYNRDINISNLPQGTYFLCIKYNEKERTIRKIVKQ